MRTTLELDEKLLADIVEMTGEKTKSKAVAKALEYYAREESLAMLLSLRGKIDLDLDYWRESRDGEHA